MSALSYNVTHVMCHIICLAYCIGMRYVLFIFYVYSVALCVGVVCYPHNVGVICYSQYVGVICMAYNMGVICVMHCIICHLCNTPYNMHYMFTTLYHILSHNLRNLYPTKYYIIYYSRIICLIIYPPKAFNSLFTPRHLSNIPI